MKQLVLSPPGWSVVGDPVARLVCAAFSGDTFAVTQCLSQGVDVNERMEDAHPALAYGILLI